MAATGIWWEKHPAMHKTTPDDTELVQDISSAKVEETCSRVEASKGEGTWGWLEVLQISFLRAFPRLLVSDLDISFPVFGYSPPWPKPHSSLFKPLARPFLMPSLLQSFPFPRILPFSPRWDNSLPIFRARSASSSPLILHAGLGAHLFPPPVFCFLLSQHLDWRS